MNKDKALNIACNFLNYLRKSDKSLIEKYSKEEIKCALSLISSSDSNKPWYKEMENRIKELDDSIKENKWHKNYFWDKIFPIILTAILTGVVAFTVGYSLKVVEVRNLKVAVQNLETRESTIQSEIKKAVASGNPSELIAMFDRVNRLSLMSKEDKRQLRALEEKEDSLLEEMRLAAAKNDTVSVSVLERELNKVREKIRRYKE